MPTRPSIAALVGSLALVGGVHAAACDDPSAIALNAKVNANNVVRAGAPLELFGFNMPWRDFQLGFVRQGAVRPELIRALKPFPGAAYRYPGGTPANWFEWANAVGPAGRRGMQHADYNRFNQVDFGLDEFNKFLADVDGKAIIVGNAIGPYKKVDTPDELRVATEGMGSVVSQAQALRCSGSSAAGCRLFAIELGNEVDWMPHNLTGKEYVARAEVMRQDLVKRFPGVPLIANGRTSPWDARSKDYKAFNEDVAAGIGGKVAGISIHPYYDGIAVSSALNYVDSYVDTIQAHNPRGGVFVTEHGRWPSQPKVGEWKQNWFQTTSIGGAVATADFLLGLMPRPHVLAANWHALAGIGPWQLLAWDQPTDKVTPSALYWGLRVLREAYLDDVVTVDYKATNTANYGGRYDQRLVAMRTADRSRQSLLGINRAAFPLSLTVDFSGADTKSLPTSLSWITASTMDVFNTAQEPDNVILQTKADAGSGSGSTRTWCVPPRSVFALSAAR